MPNAQTRTMTIKLDNIPDYGHFEEIVFDIVDDWKGENWNFALFRTSDGSEWCGHFRTGEINNFLVAEILDSKIVCIISGGHGYIIDVEKREKLKDLNGNRITSMISVNNAFFIIGKDWDIHRTDLNYNEIEIISPVSFDGIEFLEIKENKLLLELTEIGAAMKKNMNYYLDLTDWEIKKH